MTATDKVLARALIRAVMTIAAEDSEAADMDAGFDGGEWSAGFHGPGSEHVGQSIRAVLAHLNLTAQEAHNLLMDFCWNHNSPQTPVAYEVSSWISAEFEKVTL